jgi:Tfp pilus assembly protein PilO
MKKIWQRLSKREKGLVALTLFILALVVGRYVVYVPVMERRERVKTELELQPQRLEKNLRYIDQKGEIMAALEKTRAELTAFEPSLLAGDTPSVSASDLQQAVQGLATKEGTQVISTRVINPEVMGPFTKIPIQLEISGQIEQIANMVRGIETAERLLVINETNIRSLISPGVARAQAQAQSPQVQQNLRVSLTVSGFARTQTASPKSETGATKAKGGEVKKAAKAPPRPPREDSESD